MKKIVLITGLVISSLVQAQESPEVNNRILFGYGAGITSGIVSVHDLIQSIQIKKEIFHLDYVFNMHMDVLCKETFESQMNMAKQKLIMHARRSKTCAMIGMALLAGSHIIRKVDGANNPISTH